MNLINLNLNVYFIKKDEVVKYLEYFNHIYSCKYNNLIYECKIDKYNYLKKEFEKCNYKGNKEEMRDHFKRCGLIKYKCLNVN